ncbi:MAG: hypothetical protein AAGA56_30005, partial [Myxococcota bacterium]
MPVDHWAVGGNEWSDTVNNVLNWLGEGTGRPLGFSFVDEDGGMIVSRGVTTLELASELGYMKLPPSLVRLSANVPVVNAKRAAALVALPDLRFLEVNTRGLRIGPENSGEIQRQKDRIGWGAQLAAKRDLAVFMRGSLPKGMLRALAPSCNIVGLDKVSPLDLEAVGLMSKMEGLRRLRASEVDIDGVRALAKLSGLRILDISVDSSHLGPLGAVTSGLDSLTLHLDAAEQERNLSNVSALEGSALRQLTLAEGSLADHGRPIRLGPHLRSLSLSGADLERLVLPDGLQELSISSPTNPRTFAQALEPVSRSLRRLRLHEGAVPDPTIYAALGRLQSLYELEIVHGGAPSGANEVFRHLNTLPGLVSLTIGGKHLSDAGLAMMPRWPRMGALDLRGSRVSNAGIASLPPLPELRVLKLAGTRVTAAVVPLLVRRFPLLAHLDLTGVKLNEGAVKSLRPLKH